MVPSLKPERHNCADYLYDQRGHRIGDIIYCTCGRLYRLRQLTFWLLLSAWGRAESHDSYEQVWVRDRGAERVDRRRRKLREREARR